MPKYIDPRSKLLAHVDRLADLKRGVKSPPVNVEIDLSNRCSLGCEWCHFAHTHTRGPLSAKRTVETGDLMDAGLAWRVVDELADYGVRSVVWSGGGEPTLHPEFINIIGACPLPQGIYTNGQHIDHAKADTMKARMDWVYISLDAATAPEYSRAKGVAERMYNNVLANIARLVEMPGKATVGVGFLLNADNWRNAEAMLRVGLGLGVDYVQFRPTVLYDNDAPGKVDGDAAWVDEAWSMMESLANVDGVEIDLSRFAMLRDWSGHGYTRCWWSGLQTVITPDLSVWTCLNKRGFGGAKLGNLAEESFAKIWERAPLHRVDEQCRVMCRGHIANETIDQIMTPQKHEDFI